MFIDDTALVEHYDAATDENSWVFVEADAGGEVACWGAELFNADCPTP